VQQEAFLTLVKHIIDDLFIRFGTQRDRCQRLGFTTGKDGRAMAAGQVIHFAPDGADFRGLAAIQALSLVEDATTHGFFFYRVIITSHQLTFFCEHFRIHVFFIGLQDVGKGVHAGVLVGVARSSHLKRLLEGLFPNILFQVFVVYFVAIGTFDRFAYLFGQFHLSLTLNLDGFVGHLEGFEQIGFLNFFHFSFHHHDVVDGGTNHDVHVSLLQFGKGRIHFELTVNAGNPYFGNGSVERDVGYSQR